MHSEPGDRSGGYDRRYLDGFLTRILQRARMLRFPVTLLFFKLDQLKRYTDTLGHAVTDQMLKNTEALMRQTCREHDLVARIGEDTFAVVFWEEEGMLMPADAKPLQPSTPPQLPRLVLERFQHLMATQDVPGLGSGGRGVLTISAGLATFPWDVVVVAELIEAADQTMLKAAQQPKGF